MRTIPDDVLTAIADHRPHLAPIVANLRRCPAVAPQLDKSLADCYLVGETRLSALDTWRLSACCVGLPFGAR